MTTDKHSTNGKLELTGYQTTKALGTTRRVVARAVAIGLLTQRSVGTGRGQRAYFPLDEVMALKAKIDKGEWSPRMLWQHSKGRPKGSRNHTTTKGFTPTKAGMAAVNTRISALDGKLNALLNALGVTTPTAPTDTK